MIKIVVNNKEHLFQLSGDTPLLWVLRDYLGLKGAKYGCGMGQCGACTVLHGELPIRSCITPLKNVANRSITTIEGLSINKSHPLQIAWKELNVSQCGFCQSGQILSAVALLNKHKQPKNGQIVDAMSGNLCRCGTYSRIFKAIKLVMKD